MKDQTQNPKKVKAFPDLKEKAQHGDISAISTLMNRSFQRRGVTASVKLKTDCLQILLESSEVPDRSVYVSMILVGIQKLAIANVNTLEIYGKRTGSNMPNWSHKVNLSPHSPINTAINTQSTTPEIALEVQQISPDLATSEPSQKLMNVSLEASLEPQTQSSKETVKNRNSNLLSRLIQQLGNRFNLRAAIYGLLLDTISTEATVFFFSSIMTVFFTIQGKSLYQIQSEFSSNLFLIIYLCIGMTFSCAGGFFSAHCAKQNQIFNAALTGIISTSLGILMQYTSPSSVPSWFHTAALYLTIPVAIAGGYLRKISLKKQMQRA
ncbi:hypothetical protein [Pseudanabaena minima]|uniref:hypothetical protein n=1 Tax=Pseudanabaena minima TaxID=890415 RepID=UPI003DA90FB7